MPLFNSLHCQIRLDLYLSIQFHFVSLACVVFCLVFVFYVVAESESLSGVLYVSESPSSPLSLLFFCAALSLLLYAIVLLVLRILMLSEPEIVQGF